MKHHARNAMYIIKKRLPRHHYMFRIIDERYGVCYGWRRIGDGHEVSSMSFDTRVHQVHFGYDCDRRRMHIYRVRKVETKKAYPFQWQWKAFSYGTKTVAEQNERFKIRRRR
jgi:hypothetical protein